MIDSYTLWSIPILSCLKYIGLTLFFGCCCIVVFFLSPYWQKYCSFIPAGFFLPSYWQYLAVLSKRTFDTQSIHIFGLVYHLSTSRNSPFYIRSYTIFCFVLKLMFTNGKILVCKYIIWFYSNLYFCQTLIWTSLLFIYLYQVLHIWKTIFCFVLS